MATLPDLLRALLVLAAPALAQPLWKVEIAIAGFEAMEGSGPIVLILFGVSGEASGGEQGAVSLVVDRVQGGVARHPQVEGRVACAELQIREQHQQPNPTRHHQAGQVIADPIHQEV